MRQVSALLALVAALALAGAQPVAAQRMAPGDGTRQGPHLAQPVEPVEPSELLDRLFARLHEADSEQTAQVIERAINELWLRSGSATADALMQQSAKALDAKNYPVAAAMLSTVVELKPDFAEGWNRRATVYFLAGDYALSKHDIAKVLELEPRHFGALSGLGIIRKEEGDGRGALKALRRARSINPFLDRIDDRIRELEQEYDQQL